MRGNMQYYVYMLTNEKGNVLYTGVTNDLIRRVYEHKNHLDKGSFTARYNINKLVYFEVTYLMWKLQLKEKSKSKDGAENIRIN